MNKGEVVHLDDSTKHMVDTAAATATGLTFFNYLPDIVALLTGVWVLIRIYETNTVQSIIQWIKDKMR